MSAREPSVQVPTWGKGNSAKRNIRDGERDLERHVSAHIRQMPFLWLEINDASSRHSQRSLIERNIIALLSNHGSIGGGEAIDPPSTDWLGNYSRRNRVRESGLWNQRHVEDSYDPQVLEIMGGWVDNTMS